MTPFPLTYTTNIFDFNISFQFVPVGMREKLEELSLHSNEEIRSRSEKALLALNDSLPTETGRNVANVDLVEVLRL